MNDKVIGLLGGMGPEATANLYLKIIKATEVTRDQDHFRVVIDSNAKIPDRTKAILGQGESPLAEIIKTAKNLENMGADVIGIPCLTSHYFIEEIQESIGVEILNAIEVLGDHIRENMDKIRKIGVLATDGSISTGIFDKYLGEFEIVYPDQEFQNVCVMEAIYGAEGIKQGFINNKNKDLLKRAGANLIENGADVIVSGCTEIGLVLHKGDLDRVVIDPMDTLAHRLIKEDHKA